MRGTGYILLSYLVYYSIAVIFYCCIGATKIIRSTDGRRTTMVKKINSSEFEQVKNNKAIIVDFSAEWCGPCKMLAPVMEQLSDEITDVEFYNIDVDENPDLAREYRIMNIPAVIAIKGGQVAGQQIGLVSKDDMKGFIDGVF